jgi:hypothetical protein
MTNYDLMTRKFLLGEGNNSPSLRSYIQSLNEIIIALKPMTLTEKRRVEIALEHIREIKRRSRKLEEKVLMMEEKLKVLEEDKK